MNRLKSILCGITVMLFSALLCAQETTSEIQGIVTDDKNSPLAGATVTALHTPTATQYTTTTRKDGRFNLANLRIGGPYTVTISFIGFKEEKQDNITLLLGQEFKADFSLKPEAQQLTEVVALRASN